MKNKVIVITGGTRGIGFETARAFLAEGASVAILGSRAETVNKATEELKKEFKNVIGFYPDLTQEEQISATFEQIKKQFGKIDVLVNNAGLSSSTKLEAYTQKEIDGIFDINMKAPFLCSKCAVKYLKETKGCIINTSSMVTKFGQPSGCLYPMSKFAINGLTISLARELAPFGIRVNAVAPGITNTDMVAKLPPQMIEPLINSIPLKRIGEPQDIASAIVYLASEKASFITGEIIHIDGGMIS